MSTADGGWCPESPPIVTITLDEIDTALDIIASSIVQRMDTLERLRQSMLWDMGSYQGPHVGGDSNAARLMTSQMMVNKVIEDIGEDAGRAGDELVMGTLRPIQEAPHMEPDLVWNIARAFWHEVVHRGMEIGRVDAYWIKGLKEFSYDEVLVFVQHIWLAFKHYTGLDFMVPEQSQTIKTWLSLSPKLTQRDMAPDIIGKKDMSLQERKDRLQHYIDHGGPSRKLTDGPPADRVVIQENDGTIIGHDGVPSVGGPMPGNWEYDVRDD